jgi:hypothetical protein
VCLVFVVLHDVIEQVILPCLSQTFRFSREEDDETIAMVPALLYFGVKRGSKVTKVSLAGKALFPTKRCHQQCTLATSNSDRRIDFVITHISVVIRDLVWKLVRSRKRKTAICGSIGGRLVAVVSSTSIVVVSTR